MAAVAERNQDATVYVGGLDDKVTEHLLAELFIQGKFPRKTTFRILSSVNSQNFSLAIFSLNLPFSKKTPENSP